MTTRPAPQPRDEGERAAGRPGALRAGLDRAGLVAAVAEGLGALPHGAVAVVALSGGADSVALAHLAPEARPDLDLRLVHVRHGLRGGDDAAPRSRLAADARGTGLGPEAVRGDLAVVRGHARALGLPLAVEGVEVRASGDGLEAAARVARHAALRAAAERARTRWVLLGHTADDQAETVLLRLARGTGLTGLAGMAGVRDGLVRPLLRVRRADVHAFVRGEGLEHLAEPGNDDPRFARNRTRHEVLPVLSALSRDPVGALTRLADLARDDARHLDRDADVVGDALLRGWGPTVAVRVEALHDLDPAMARRVVRLAVRRVRGGRAPTAAQVADVLELPNGRLASMPGVVASSGGGWLALRPDPPPGSAEVALDVPGRTPWPAAGLAVVATTPGPTPPAGQLRLELGDVPTAWTVPEVAVDPALVPPGGDAALGQVAVPADVLDAGLVLRPRADGDRVRTRAGTRLLSDVLGDRGVPRALRELLPVLSTAGRVLWVPFVVADAGLADHPPAAHLAVAAAAPDGPRG